MTIRKASRIIGSEIDSYLTDGAVWVIECNLQDVDVHLATVSVTDRDKERGAQKLVDECWKVRSSVVAKRAGYRCEECGGRVGLSVHHKKFRSHGRLDTIDNLVLLDHACHEAYHSQCHKSKTSQVNVLGNLRK